MKFTGICPITEETASIDIHPIYCGSNENPGFYTKGDIRFCTAKGSQGCSYGENCPIKQNAPEVFKLK